MKRARDIARWKSPPLPDLREQVLTINIERHIWHGYWYAETVKNRISGYDLPCYESWESAAEHFSR